jgi:hypothetical protein
VQIAVFFAFAVPNRRTKAADVDETTCSHEYGQHCLLTEHCIHTYLVFNNCVQQTTTAHTAARADLKHSTIFEVALQHATFAAPEVTFSRHIRGSPSIMPPPRTAPLSQESWSLNLLDREPTMSLLPVAYKSREEMYSPALRGLNKAAGRCCAIGRG